MEVATQENIMLGLQTPAMFAWTQPDGQFIQLPGFVNEEGTVSLFLPSDTGLVLPTEAVAADDVPEGELLEFSAPSGPVLGGEEIIDGTNLLTEDELTKELPLKNNLSNAMDLLNGLNTLESEMPGKRGRPPKRKITSPTSCSKCGEIFESPENYVEHMKTHANQKEFACLQCNMSYNFKINLVIHESIHDPSMTCSLCQKKFTRMASLRAHLTFHEEEDNVTCFECGEEFDMIAKLADHVNSEHKKSNQDKNSYQCALCNEKLGSVKLLAEHTKAHEKATPVLSLLKGKKSKSAKINSDWLQTIKRAKRRSKQRGPDARKSKTHECNDCDAKFQKKSQLERHVRIHTGEKPYKCEECDAAFNQSGSLTIHMSKHNGFKPHLCVYCGNSFIQRCNLVQHVQKVHMMTNDGTEYHMCPHCPSVFKKRVTLHCHLTRYHDQKNDDIYEVLDEDVEEAEKSKLNGLSTGVAPKMATKQIPVRNGIVRISLGNNTTAEKSVQETNTPVEQPLTMVKNTPVCSTPPVVIIKSTPVTAKPPLLAKPGIQLGDGAIRKTGVITLSKSAEAKGAAANSPKKDNVIRLSSATGSEVIQVMPNECDNVIIVPHEADIDGFADLRTEGTHFDIIQEALDATDLPDELLLGPENAVQPPAPTSFPFRAPPKKSEHTFKCKVCQKSFAKPGPLIKHMKALTCWDSLAAAALRDTEDSSGGNGFGFTCQQQNCGEKFFSRKMLRQHELSTHEDNEEFFCQSCNVKVMGLVSFKHHLDSYKHRSNIAVVTPLMRVDENGEQVTVLGRLDGHIRASQIDSLEERPHQCQTCSLRFRKVSHLKQHIVSQHTRDRPFQCNVCKATFNKYSVLKTHVRTHLPIKQQPCPLCLKVFSTKHTLARHMLTHSHNKQFLCQICLLRFKTKEACKMHIYRNHLEEITDPTPELFMSNNLMGAMETDPLAEEPEDTYMNLTDDAEQITLPHLSKESIQELEQSLSQQFFSTQTDGTTVGEKELMMAVNNLEGDYTSGGVQDMFQNFGLELTESDTPGDETDTAVAHDLAEFGAQVFCEQCDWRGFSQRDLELHFFAEHNATTIEPRTKTPKRSKSSIKEFTREEAVQILASTDLNDDPTDSEKILADAAAERLGQVRPKVRTKTKSSPIVCEQCDKAFTRFSDLERHIRTHTGEKPFGCSLCEKRFTTKSTLVSHMKLHTTREKLLCALCGTEFSYRSSLKVHMRLHTGSRPFNCNVCNEKFRTSGHLKVHMGTHWKIKQPRIKKPRQSNGIHLGTLDEYISNDLGCVLFEDKPADNSETILSSFPESLLSDALTALNNTEEPIIASLSEDKPITASVPDEAPITKRKTKTLHKCNLCDKAFDKPSLLARHERVHSGYRPFHCEYCVRSFNQRNVLIDHMKTHTGQKDYACMHCGFKSVQKSNLKHHMVKYHKFAYYYGAFDEKAGSSRTLGFAKSRKMETADNLELNLGDVRPSDLDLEDLFQQVP